MSHGASTQELAARLADAVRSGAIRVHMQPVVSLPSMRVVGCEALARWTDPVLGTVPPDRFIRVAEERGHIVELGRHVLNEACAVAATWQHLPEGRFVSVNVSALQLAEPGFTREVARALTDSGLPPHRLVLELTETAALGDVEGTAAQLGELRTMGVHLALDDFGVGQSPLTLLSRLPFDVVKIERTFVARVHERAHDAVVSRIVIEAAHSLGLRVCAEGIELPEQAQQLVSMGCDLAQGYLMARPYDPSSGTAPHDVVQVRSPYDPAAPAPIQLGGTDELVVVTDANRVITYASLGCLHLLGYRPTELIGTKGPSYLPAALPDPLPALDDPGRLRTRSLPPYRVQHRDGSWRWFTTRVQVLTHPDGSLREAVSTSKDVTAEMEAEHQRAGLEAQLRWAFDGAPIGMAMSTFDGRIVRANDTFASMLGRSGDDLHDVLVADITHPDDRDRDAKNLDLLEAQEQTRQRVTKRYLHANGHPVTATVWVTALPPEQDRPGVVLAHILSHGDSDAWPLPVAVALPDGVE
ncbi:MAG TPA: EAL domain-containing protein [Actinomycetales bacterium]|nr:EAL domain-containing protein [Actinomycetales bacterium]